MKIVVLGANGFIGKALREQLRLKGIEHEAVYTSATAGEFTLDRNAGWVDEYLAGADIVYQCAGRTGGVGRMANDPLSFVFPNVRIHMNVFEACAKANVRRVVVLNSTTGYPDSPDAVTEDQYLDGDVYPGYFGPGNAHRFIYRLSHLFPAQEFVFFRPSNVYGPANNFDPQTSHVIEATVRKAAEGQDPFVIWGTGYEERDAIYIDDLAEAMTLALDCPAGAYNVGTGSAMSVNDMVKILCGRADHRPLFSHDRTKPSAIPQRRVNVDKLRALGWMHKVGMEEGLRRTYDWFLANR